MEQRILVRKTFLVDQDMLDKMELIRKYESCLTLTEVFRMAINLLYKEGVGIYKNNKIGVGIGNNEEYAIKNAQLKVKTKMAMEKAEQDERNTKKVSMCEDIFNGEVMEKADGSMVCVYTSYNAWDEKLDEVLELPLAQLDTQLADNTVLVPSKDAVFKNRSEIKKKFKRLSYYNDVNETTNQEEE
jgi:hypothetical protein